MIPKVEKRMEIRLEATIPTTETPMATAMPGRAMDRLGRRMGAALCNGILTNAM